MGECTKTCCVIYISLILMTVGFGLTLMGWFAPPMNHFVLTVRTGGRITLLIGSVLLLCSCFMCAVDQGNCWQCCYDHNRQSIGRKSKLHDDHNTSTTQRHATQDNSVVIANDNISKLRLAHCPSAYQAVAQQEWIKINIMAHMESSPIMKPRLAEEETFSDIDTSDDEQLNTVDTYLKSSNITTKLWSQIVLRRVSILDEQFKMFFIKNYKKSTFYILGYDVIGNVL